ncbi:MAG: hypothetical protein V1758_15890 [Pseudomonadota bacterium]
MTPSARLGGFKILKDVVRISVFSSEASTHFPAHFCRIIAENEINLPYFTSVTDGQSWGLNIVVEAIDEARLLRLIKKRDRLVFPHDSRSAVLSIFPHKRNPEIPGKLFEALSNEGLDPEALANSPSAISVVLKQEFVNRASDALFEPFNFGAYRTPADWKLAQEGKEQLYKEVVASYQEQKPKVYGLEVYDEQELLQMKITKGKMGDLGASFREFARLGLNLTFLVSGPCRDQGEEVLAFTLPTTQGQAYTRIINRIAPDIDAGRISPVCVFSMNGPHFGDRYGIASELLTTFENRDIELLGLSCTIASVTGVVPSRQLQKTIEAIQQCFEVPSVARRE